MENDSQNPYAPPSPVESHDKLEEADRDPKIQDSLNRAFFAATYGVVFLPGLAYLISLYALWEVGRRRSEFSESQHVLFQRTRMINIFMLIPYSIFVLVLLGDAVFGMSLGF